MVTPYHSTLLIKALLILKRRHFPLFSLAFLEVCFLFIPIKETEKGTQKEQSCDIK